MSIQPPGGLKIEIPLADVRPNIKKKVSESSSNKTVSFPVSEKVSECLKEHKGAFLGLNPKIIKDLLLDQSFNRFRALYDKIEPIESRAGLLFHTRTEKGIFHFKNGEAIPKPEQRYWTRYIFEHQEIYDSLFLKTMIEATMAMLPVDQKKERSVVVFLNRKINSSRNFEWLDENEHCPSQGKVWVVHYNIYRSPYGIKGGSIHVFNEGAPDIRRILEKPLDCIAVKKNGPLIIQNSPKMDEGAVIDTLTLHIDREQAIWGPYERRAEVEHKQNNHNGAHHSCDDRGGGSESI